MGPGGPVLTFESDRFRDTETELPTGHFYRARSVGGEETCHQFPGLDVCFDIGYAPMSATSVGRVFLSHGQSDHAGGIVRHSIRRIGRDLPATEVFVPPFLDTGVRQLASAYEQLEGSRKTLSVTVIGKNSHVRITPDRYVTTFPTTHRIPCVGHTIWQERKRLRPELAGKSGREIADARKRGEEVSESFVVPDVTYCGDTSVDVLDQHEHVLRSNVLILECTMLDDQVSVADTRKAGHVHLDELVQRAEQFRDVRCLVLSHFSTRYRTGEIRKLVEGALPSWLTEKTFLLLPLKRG
jgi:ribonuclease Z